MMERTLCSVAIAARLVDRLTARPIAGAQVRITGRHQQPIAKEDGFYVFTDLPAEDVTLQASAPGYQLFDHTFALPLPTGDRRVLDVPGENELFLSVITAQSSPEEKIITFAARDFFKPIPSGTRIISDKIETRLAATLEGEEVSQAVLEDIGSGPDQLGQNDVVRLIGERVVQMRPGPSYWFAKRARRLVGVVADGADGSPIPDATVTLTEVNDQIVDSEELGTALNRVRVYTIGNDDSKRVIGTRRDIESRSGTRGGYCFYLPERRDLIFNKVMISAAATGYSGAGSVIELAGRSQVFTRLMLDPS